MTDVQLPTVNLADLPLPVAVAMQAARDALEHANPLCRFHGDCPPARYGPGAGRGTGCEECAQPARVRRALAYFRALTGEPPPPRRYQLDIAGGPHRVSGGYKVLGVAGLWAPADQAAAAALIERTLADRGELGPFDVLLTIPGGA